MGLDVATATAQQLSQALNEQVISSRELLDLLLARAETVNPAINAIVERRMADRVLDVDGTTVPYLSAMAWCGAIGAVNLPVVTLPAGRTQGGLPVGVQVIGPFLSDMRLLRIAELLDAAAGPGFTAPPTGIRS
jgi:Asp-tRNA(Asn)/Glu-tRNA(Gln) amidotransferase A subunit family amidase